MKKKPTLYVIIILLWTACVCLLFTALGKVIAALSGYTPVRLAFIIILLTVNTAVLAILWFGSIKDFIFSVSYAVNERRISRMYSDVEKYKYIPKPHPKFLLLYCTCNDFNPKALSACRKQKYKNVKTAILDDSSDGEYLSRINAYCRRHKDIELVRRKDRTGYKAGNLNNYLKDRKDYDYFVVLDSDEVIPPDYIVKVLKYFNYNPSCGAVQARHTATKGGNVFQRLMGLCVGSNGKTVQVIKNFYGANALIGHGMTISRTCYERTGGFPMVVAEDISFAVEIKNAGLDIIYAPDILCYEEFPVNYVSLKKRQCKWTQGNLEYMKKYNSDINDCPMSWFEKLDIKLSHYSLPIVPVLSFLLAVCTISLGFLGYPVINYSFGIYAIMILFLCSPLIPDLFVYKSTSNLLLLIPYFIVNIATYASLAPMMLKTVLLGVMGKKAVFTVTPKSDEKFTVWEMIKYTRDSLIFAIILGALSYVSCGSIFPVVFITFGCLSAPFIIALSNIPVKSDGERELPHFRRGPLFNSAATPYKALHATLSRRLNKN